MKLLHVAVAVAVVVFLFYAISFLIKKTRKEKYMNGTTLGPILRSPNSETHDVLEYSLGGFGGSPRKSC
jgi:hypothetical protein